MDRNNFKLWMLLTAFVICVPALASDTTDVDRKAWEEWNKYVSQLVVYDKDRPDELETFNRKIFIFNDYVDRVAVAPVARGYDKVTPDLVQRGISNFFANLSEVTTVANDILQMKFRQTASDSGRFLVNTTVGLFGLFDVASAIGLEKNTEDFGQTMGYWGISPGPYVVLPFMGPATFRDALGNYADNTTSYVAAVDHVRTRNQMIAIDLLQVRVSLFAAEDLIAGDKYTFIRDAYLQRREFLVKDGLIDDTFGEDVDWGDEEWGDEEWGEEDAD